MPDSPRQNRYDLERTKSRLGRTLLRLHGRPPENAGEETHLVNWQETWTHRRDRISRRLELIETQLERLMHNAAPPPRFSVVGGPVESDET